MKVVRGTPLLPVFAGEIQAWPLKSSTPPKMKVYQLNCQGYRASSYAPGYSQVNLSNSLGSEAMRDTKSRILRGSVIRFGAKGTLYSHRKIQKG